MTSVAELISSGIAALRSNNPRAAVTAAKQLAQRVSISEDPQNVSEVSELGNQLSAVADLVTAQVGGPAPLVSPTTATATAAAKPAVTPDWQPEALPPQPDPMIRDATAAWVPLKSKFDALAVRKATVVADESVPNVQQFLAAAKDYATALAAYKKQFRDWRGRNLPTVQVAARDAAIAKSLSPLPSSKPNPAISRDAAAAYEELETLRGRAEELQLSTTGSDTRNTGRNTDFFTARDQYEAALAAYNKKYKSWTGASKTNADVKALEASMRDITKKGIPALPERPTDPEIEDDWGYLEGLYRSLTASKQEAQAAMVAGKGTRDAAKNIQYRTNYEQYVSALDEYTRSHKQYSTAEAAVMAEPDPLPTDPARVPNAPKGAKASWDALSGLYRDLLIKQQQARSPRADNPTVRNSSQNSEYVGQLEAYNKALAAYRRSVKSWTGTNLVEAGKGKLHDQISAAVALPLAPPPDGPEFDAIRAKYEEVNRIKQELLLDPTREAHVTDYENYMGEYRGYKIMSDPVAIFKIMKRKADTAANPIVSTSSLGDKSAASISLQEAIQFGESLKKKELREDIKDLKSRLELINSYTKTNTSSNWRATATAGNSLLTNRNRNTESNARPPLYPPVEYVPPTVARPANARPIAVVRPPPAPAPARVANISEALLPGGSEENLNYPRLNASGLPPAAYVPPMLSVAANARPPAAAALLPDGPVENLNYPRLNALGRPPAAYEPPMLAAAANARPPPPAAAARVANVRPPPPAAAAAAGNSAEALLPGGSVENLNYLRVNASGRPPAAYEPPVLAAAPRPAVANPRLANLNRSLRPSPAAPNLTALQAARRSALPLSREAEEIARIQRTALEGSRRAAAAAAAARAAAPPPPPAAAPPPPAARRGATLSLLPGSTLSPNVTSAGNVKGLLNRLNASRKNKKNSNTNVRSTQRKPSMFSSLLKKKTTGLSPGVQAALNAYKTPEQRAAAEEKAVRDQSKNYIREVDALKKAMKKAKETPNIELIKDKKGYVTAVQYGPRSTEFRRSRNMRGGRRTTRKKRSV